MSQRQKRKGANLGPQLPKKEKRRKLRRKKILRINHVKEGRPISERRNTW